MTGQLPDLLNDLVEQPSSLIRVDPHDAARRGIRRRRRRRVGTAVVVLVAAVGAAVGLSTASVQPHPDPADGGTTAQQYPDRLDQALVEDDALPTRPGPLAGLVERVSRHGTYDEPIGWFAVSPVGQIWPVTDGYTGGAYPALSADGVHLGFQQDPSTYVIRNLITGVEVRYPQVAGFAPESDYTDPGAIEFEFDGDEPTFWSPDNQRLILLGNDYPDQHLVGVAVVLQPSGNVTLVRAEGHPNARVVGWLDDTHLAWLSRRAVGADPGPGTNTIALLVTDLRGHLVRDVPVAYTGSASRLYQFSVGVSPDGSTLAVLPDTGSAGRARTSLFDTRTGLARGRVDYAAADLAANCGYTWQGNRPAYPTEREDETALLDADSRILVTASDDFGAECSTWSSTALLGSPHHTPTTWIGLHRGPFGVYVISGVATLGIVVVLVMASCRRRRIAAARPAGAVDPRGTGRPT